MYSVYCQKATEGKKSEYVRENKLPLLDCEQWSLSETYTHKPIYFLMSVNLRNAAQPEAHSHTIAETTHKSHTPFEDINENLHKCIYTYFFP